MALEYGLAVETAPTVLPVSVADAKRHLRVDVTDEDDLIESLIQTARGRMENNCNRTLINTSWKLTCDRFPTVFYLPRSPVSSITSVKYYDSGGTQQTLNSAYYQLCTGRRPDQLVQAYGYSWPATQDRADAVELIYVAGEGAAASDVPDALIAAMKMDIAHLYENREAVVLGTIATMLPAGYDALTADYHIRARVMD